MTWDFDRRSYAAMHAARGGAPPGELVNQTRLRLAALDTEGLREEHAEAHFQAQGGDRMGLLVVWCCWCEVKERRDRLRGTGPDRPTRRRRGRRGGRGRNRS